MKKKLRRENVFIFRLSTRSRLASFNLEALLLRRALPPPAFAMGRSLRRAKRYRTKVRVGVEKKRKNVKAPAPLELTLESGAAALAVKLPNLVSTATAAGEKREGEEEAPTTTTTTTWNPSRPLTKNYAAAGVAADANARYGRNHRPSISKAKVEEEENPENESDGDGDRGGGGDSTDDDLRAVSGLPRKHSARAPPAKLTSTQEGVIAALREAHGGDVEAMVKDTKLNRMLLPASKLKKMIEADDFWGRRPGKPSLDQVGIEGKGRGRCGFRMPRKSL